LVAVATTALTVREEEFFPNYRRMWEGVPEEEDRRANRLWKKWFSCFENLFRQASQNGKLLRISKLTAPKRKEL
jgi:hypothetical protein